MSKNIFIGVAWPYVNGDLHVGHLAGYLLPCDICARYHRAVGHKVLMVSGSDCHGTPITVEADKRGATPKEIADEYHEKDTHLFRDLLGITYDIYTRTDTPHHAKVTQDIFMSLLDAGYIFVVYTKQYFSSEEKRFLPDRYVVGVCPFCGAADTRSDQCDSCGKLIAVGELINPKSNLSKKSVDLKETQHYFVDWSKLQPEIEKYVERVSGGWKVWVSQETKGWLKEGLKPRPITRDIDWGVELPKDRIPEAMLIDGIENKRLYVWFDAVIGYLSASLLWTKEGYGNWQDFWYGSNVKHYYFMGKDNLAFHTLFWPGKLMVYDKNLHLPDVVSINMFLNFDGRQFSKSRGVAIDTKALVEQYGNDRVRFYITLIMPETRDTSFSWDDFREKVNGVLVGNVGNFVHRSLSIARSADIDAVLAEKLQESVKKEVGETFTAIRKYLENCEFRNALDVVISLSSFGNRLVDSYKIWELDKSSRQYFQAVKNLYFIILTLGYLFIPLLPEASKKVFKLLGLVEDSSWPAEGEEVDFLETRLAKIDTRIEPAPLFGKIDRIGGGTHG